MKSDSRLTGTNIEVKREQKICIRKCSNAVQLPLRRFGDSTPTGYSRHKCSMKQKSITILSLCQLHPSNVLSAVSVLFEKNMVKNALIECFVNI